MIRIINFQYVFKYKNGNIIKHVPCQYTQLSCIDKNNSIVIEMHTSLQINTETLPKVLFKEFYSSLNGVIIEANIQFNINKADGSMVVRGDLNYIHNNISENILEHIPDDIDILFTYDVVASRKNRKFL